MKIQTYNNEAVISSEEFYNYLRVEGKGDSIRAYLGNSKFVKGVEYYHLDPHEARICGLKEKYNYPLGLNVFTVKGILRIAEWDRGKILDIPKLLKDAGIENPDLVLVSEVEVDKKKVTNKVVNKVANKTGNPTVQMPFDQLFAMVDIQMEKQAAFIQCLQESNERLVDEVSRLTGAVDSLMQVLTQTSVNVKSPQSESEILNVPALSESVFDVPLIIKEDTSYEEWKKTINHALDLIIRDGNDVTRSSILHDAYDRIRAQYGIVWEQEAKEFKIEFGRGPVNTKELCWWMETRKSTYKNLLIGKLNTIYSEIRRGKAV